MLVLGLPALSGMGIMVVVVASSVTQLGWKELKRLRGPGHSPIEQSGLQSILKNFLRRTTFSSSETAVGEILPFAKLSMADFE